MKGDPAAGELKGNSMESEAAVSCASSYVF